MIQAICWVLIHSLWQGLLLSLGGGVVILCTKRSAAAVRYRLLFGLFALFLAGVGATFFYEWHAMSGGGDDSAPFGIPMNRLAEWCSANAYPIVLIWLMAAVVKSVRMATGWTYIWRIRREGLAAPSLWVERMTALCRMLDIRRTVKLVESGLVKVPIVIGQLKPIIYVPLGLINHLPAGEMEAVLLHELAHVRRYDHVVNIVLQVAECLLFFNPGFLWVSWLMREERENCCDDTAIGCTKDRIEFVRALVRFKEHSLGTAALAFPGNKRQLLHRVIRISRRENNTLSARERFSLLAGGIVLLCVLAARVERVAGKPPVLQILAATSKVEETKVQAVRPASPELVAVLRTRQQVAQNMEWVQGQLEQLHHQARTRVAYNRKAHQQAPQAQHQGPDLPVEAQKSQQAEQDQAEVRGRDQAEQDMQRAGDLGRDEADVQGRAQAERDRRQAERDRHQAELDRQQAERDREQAERDRQQAMRDREQAMRDRAQADRNRQQADRDRQRAEKEHKEVIDQHQ